MLNRILMAVGLLALGSGVLAAGDLEKNFVNPPDSAKASGYWWWLNANVDKEAITRDMDEFSAKGIGSVLLVCSGNWAGPNHVRGPAFLFKANSYTLGRSTISRLGK